MCGVVGLITRSPVKNYDQIFNSIKHRGPDSSRTETFSHGDWQAHLGHHRLSIIDLASGDQPMSRGGDTIVFNGEIYNYQKLKEKYIDGPLRTTSDTEVLLELFRSRGDRAFSLLDGFFGFGIYNKNKNELVLARDRWGIKPLYYAHLADGGILFASELFPFLKTDLIKREVSLDTIQNYLFWDYAPDESSFLSGVKKLKPGHSLVWRNGQIISVDRFYDPADLLKQPRREKTDKEVWGDIKTAVKESLVSDVQVGVLLSGGIDSSLVAVAAAEEVGKGIPTFSIGFSEKDFDESAYAKIVSDQIQSEHHVQMIGESDLIERWDEIVSGLDEPMSDPSILPTRILCELARNRVKVVLGGDGGDELFGGYPTYRAHRARRVFDAMPSALFGALNSTVQQLKIGEGYQPFAWKLKRLVNRYDSDPVHCHFRWMSNTDISDIEKVSGAAHSIFPNFNFDLNAADLQTYMYLDLITYLPYSVLTKVDRASMAVGLECRPPFLTNDFVSKAFTLPTHQKVSLNHTKMILRKVAEGRLPHEITSRSKRGFAIPLAKWLRGPLKPQIQSLLKSSPLWEGGFLIKDQAIQMWESFEGRRGDYAKTFWALLVLDHWMRHHDVKGR